MERFDVNRRGFLKSLSALSMAALPSLKPEAIGQLFPKLLPAEEIIPGMPYWYASTCRECPVGCGVLIKVRDGNVIKIEGNPQHPINKGGLCPRGQAALQELYSVDRVRNPMARPKNAAAKELTWDEAITEIKSQLKPGKTVFLSGHLSGSQEKFVKQWLNGLPGETELVIYEPAQRQAPIKANEIVFGQAVPTLYHLDQADLVLSFGADFMETWQNPVGLSHDFAQARRFHEQKSAKLVYVGSIDTLTGCNADQEFRIPPKSELFVILALANSLLENGNSQLPLAEKFAWQNLLAPFSFDVATKESGLTTDALQKLSELLKENPQGVVLCGDSLSAHALGTLSQIAVNILNYLAGYYGKTVSLGVASSAPTSGSGASLSRLISEMEQGAIANLLINNTNPVYTWPDSAQLKVTLEKVALKIALTTTPNDTTELVDYLLPVHHAIETWGIESPQSGVYSVVQPAMQPVFNSRPMEEVLAALSQSTGSTDKLDTFIENEWQAILRNVPDGENRLLNGGFWTETPSPAQVLPTAPGNLKAYLVEVQTLVQTEGLMAAMTLSHRYFDGRGANKPWLWEMPDNVNNHVWETPLRMHPDVAANKNLREGDIVTVSANGRQIEAPVLITPDIHPKMVAIEIGAGHTNYGEAAIKETGNPLALLPTAPDKLSGDTILFAENVEINKTGKWRKIVRVQGNYNQGKRGIIQSIPLAEAVALEKNGEPRQPAPAPQIYPVHEHKLYDWGMVIDLSACNGCGACVTACYAENAVPVVGKQSCSKGREMAWIRIEKFKVDDRWRFIPMMCQHCEAAPCETVCPVYATVHSQEGLNLQVYNRCVGTRYCSNNCPYKARRFNYFPAQWPEPTQRQLNPDIYHRPKGVMEKCTFCVQRIRKAKEDAKIEGRTVRDGEVIPACAQSCPTNAITFGNLNDPESKVSKLIKNARGYFVFESLNTQPSVLYLKGIKHE